MRIELEQEQSTDVSTEVSSDPQSDKAASDASSPEPKEASTEPKEKYVPYERFQEIVQQKNEFLKRFEDNERRYQELQTRLNETHKTAEQSKSVEQKLIDRLKGIDPEFGTWAEQQEAARKQLESVVQAQRQAAEAATRSEVSSTLERLHSEYKVPKDLQEIYKTTLRAKAMENPNLKPTDLPNLYKQVHADLNKVLEGYKRSVLASYSTGKKADASIPAAQKGPAPKTSTKPQFSKDRETALDQVVKRALELRRANNDV